MPLLFVPGAELFYETRGSGPPIVLIPPAGGVGSLYSKVAPSLATYFTVITYDRRGHSQSLLTGEQDYDHRLQRDADDVAELIKHISSSSQANNNGNASAFVLGSSSGAIVALSVLCRHPSLVRKVVCHEPPLMNVLGDDERDKQLATLRSIHSLYRAKGMPAAMAHFGQDHFAQEDAEAMPTVFNPRADPYAVGNWLYWFEREMVNYPATEVPWLELEKPEIQEKLIVGVSEGGADLPAAQVAKALSKKLDLGSEGLVIFPGAHLGYITQPERFAVVLKDRLKL